MTRRKTNWDRYFEAKMRDPAVRAAVEAELRALRLGAAIASLRQRQHLSQTQLAARAGMSGPNVARIESRPSQNLTIRTLARLALALDHDVEISFRPRKTTGRRRATRLAAMAAHRPTPSQA